MDKPGYGMKVYLLAREDVEALLAAKYGKKLAAVKHTKLANLNRDGKTG